MKSGWKASNGPARHTATGGHADMLFLGARAHCKILEYTYEAQVLKQVPSLDITAVIYAFVDRTAA